MLDWLVAVVADVDPVTVELGASGASGADGGMSENVPDKGD